jgi:hypothetical protein
MSSTQIHRCFSDRPMSPLSPTVTPLSPMSPASSSTSEWPRFSMSVLQFVAETYIKDPAAGDALLDNPAQLAAETHGAMSPLVRLSTVGPPETFLSLLKSSAFETTESRSKGLVNVFMYMARIGDQRLKRTQNERVRRIDPLMPDVNIGEFLQTQSKDSHDREIFEKYFSECDERPVQCLSPR